MQIETKPDDIADWMPIRGRPFNHQREAFAFAADQFGITTEITKSSGVALLMEMGTGKSLVGIALVGSLYQFGKADRALVVAPLSVTGVWEEEFVRFADFPFTLTVLKGSVAKKREQLQNLSNDGLQIVVVNYESAWRLEKELLAYDPDIIIADEGHKIKDHRSRQSKCMHHLGDKARYKLLLTGTVISNRELDVYSQYRFLNQGIFGSSFYTFRSRYFDMVGYGNHTPVFRSWMTAEFLDKLHSIAFRVTKAECLDLPAVTEEIRMIDLEPKVRKLYDEIERESYAELGKSEVTVTNILTKMVRLSQISGGHLPDDDGRMNTVSTAKLGALEDIVDSAVAGGSKLVVIARFSAELDDIQRMLERKRIGCAVIRGGVKDRQSEIDRFQNDDSCPIFLGQIAAAGLGITLTAASAMVFFSVDYSYSNFDQAKARIHRAGQTQSCTYIYLCCRNTIDRKVLSALGRKQDLARSLVDDYRHGGNPFRSEDSKNH